MNILIDVVKLLRLYLRKVAGGFSFIGGVPPMPYSPQRPTPMPRTKRPEPPKGQDPKPKPDRFRLVPNTKGTYTLEQYNEYAEDYICKRVNVTPQEADESISNLERETIYYRELKGRVTNDRDT